MHAVGLSTPGPLRVLAHGHQLQRAQAFLQAFREVAADGHGFADAFLLRDERGTGLR